MLLIQEFKELYQQARKAKDEKNNFQAQVAYDRIISIVRKDIFSARKKSSFDFNIFDYDEEIKNILFDKLKQNGFSILPNQYGHFFEVSGWVDEESSSEES